MKNARAVTPGVTPRVAPQEAGPDHSQETQAEGDIGPEFAIASDLRRVMAGPQTFNPATIMRLQHTIGNRSVQRLLQGQKPQTALARTAPNVVQRAKGAHPTYTAQAGQTWKDIATLHGFFSATPTPKMSSFVDSNQVGWTNLDAVVTTGKVIKLPRGTVPVAPTTTAVTGTGGTTGVPLTTGGPPPVPNQAELGTVLSAIGKFLDWAASKPGDKYSFEFGFRVPVYGGIFLGLKLSGEVERDSADSNGVAPLKLDSKLGIEGKASYTFLYYGQVDFGASLVRNIKAESTRGGSGAMEALSFGLYRSVQETSYIPGRIMNWIWGNDREAWSGRTAGRISAAEDKAFVGTAVAASVGSSFGGEEGGEGTKFGLESVLTKGTEYNKESIDKGDDDGSGGKKGKMESGWLGKYETSLGESKTTMEFSGKMEILGAEASFKLAREGTEWGIEAGISLGTFSKLEGESPTEKITKLYEKISAALGATGSKLTEQVKALAKVASLSKKVIRNSNQIAGLLTSGLPGKDQFALVLYQGMNGPSKPSTSLVPYSGGGGTSTGLVPSSGGGGLPTGALSGGSKPLMLPAPSGWYNVDEGKTEADAKFLLGLKYNITKKEFEAGLDVSFEAGFDSSALTVKGAKTKRLLKWKRP